MKKEYCKPELYFESFELSANIAANCGFPLNHTMVACQPISGMTLFLETSNCETTPEANGLCYQAFEEEKTLFTS